MGAGSAGALRCCGGWAHGESDAGLPSDLSPPLPSTGGSASRFAHGVDGGETGAGDGVETGAGGGGTGVVCGGTGGTAGTAGGTEAAPTGRGGGVSCGTGRPPCTGASSSSGGQNGSTSRSGVALLLVPGT